METDNGIEVLAAAYPALNRVGDGSSPSGPTRSVWIFDNLARTCSAHDVAVACCSARAVGSVQIRLGALYFSVWESLEIRVPWEHEIVGSNPTTLTDVMRWVLCWYGKATVNRRDAGSIPATAARCMLKA